MTSDQQPDLPLEPTASRKLSVSQLTQWIKGTLEPAFSDVWVVGEVSNYRPAASGHVYFSLKDESAMVSAAAFGWGRRRAGFELRDGMQVAVHGRVTVYAPRGSYQLTVDQIEPLGAGALQKAFEQLKAKLQGEGLFSAERKRALPKFPKTIAVITSPSGAAIRDMLNILERRAPFVKVVIVPALVQGDEASQQLIRALRVVNRCQVGDVVVLARGGGSIEDLWCFNSEELARVIAESSIPVVSAVGHEIDFTISDFVSDLRAPTPSAAAELITAHWVDVSRFLLESQTRMSNALRREINQKKSLLQHVAARLVSPKDRLREQAQRCDELGLRLTSAIRIHLERSRAQVEKAMLQLNALSPLRVLERGYSIVLDRQTHHVQRSAQEIHSGQLLRLRFNDGMVDVRAE